MSAAQIPVLDGLFEETPQGAHLLGSKCASCGAPYFPRVETCHNPDCIEKRVEDAAFGPSGKIWSYTIMHYPPVAPAKYDEPFSPYAVAQVDLEGGVRVNGRISDKDDISSVAVGRDVRLILETLYHDEDGNERITWKFKLV